jgi:2-polyprenyl-3-methyl-5-hydroxy-6-metoxy-1,4-benzoquinol methylase
MRANEHRERNIRKTFEKGIKPHISGNKVLHVGCVAHDESKRESGNWTHGLIVEEADEVLGIDILQEDIEKLQNEGYNVEYADAENFELNQTFDTIVLGELIEHLTDFDGLLRSIRKHLAPDGKLVITTPNAMAVHWTALRFLNIEFVNREHTCWFDNVTITQLLERYGFRVVETSYSGDASFRLTDPLQAVGWVIERILPERVGKSTLIVISKQ